MEDKEKIEALEAQLKELSATVSTLEGNLKDTKAERDELVAAKEAVEKTALIGTIVDLEGKNGKTEVELVEIRKDLEAKSLGDVDAQERAVVRAFAQDPPEVKPRIPTTPAPAMEGDRTKRPDLFGKSGVLHQSVDGGTA